MKLSDYIVDFLIKQGVEDVFGYPGGMVTHLMDSLNKRKNEINNHLLYHEQGAAFAGCGYVQSSSKPTVVYATSGPGATNLITGICDAFFDSTPLVFITGQVNRNESSISTGLRQRGFQETQITDIVRPVTKESIYVSDPLDIKYYLEKAFFRANEGRKGPVLLDIPMDVFRAEIDVSKLRNYLPESITNTCNFDFSSLKKYHKPVLVIGSGLKYSVDKETIRSIVNRIKIPVVTSMLSFDLLSKDNSYNFGFLGAYGDRVANFIIAKADLIISIGARLDVRQVGGKRGNFASDADIVRFDVDQNELNYKVRENEIGILLDAKTAFTSLDLLSTNDYSSWLSVCNQIKSKLINVDLKRKPELCIKELSKRLNGDEVITTDVGQNQVWVAQFLDVKDDNLVLFSGGHGAMGFSLPASIGASYANPGKRIISFNGDGGIQMNIQELQTVFRDKLPITIVVFNNYALGMIRHFQEMYFNSQYEFTTKNSGYTVPDFVKIAEAYGIRASRICDISEIKNITFGDEPQLIEICIDEETYVFPKLEFGKPNQDQEPLIDRNLYDELMKL